MRSIAVKIAVFVPTIAYAWAAAASGLYLWGVGKLNLFRFPFVQWFSAAPWWQLNLKMTICVIGSAAAPSLLLAVCTFGMSRHRWKHRQTRGQSHLYGKTGWADHDAMRAGGLRLRERL